MDLILAIQKDRSVRQLELDAPALATLSQLLKAVADDYLNDIELHDYSPGFKPDDHGMLRVKFKLPASLQRCSRQTPSDLQALDPKAAVATPPVALVGVEQGTSPRFAFQSVDGRMMLHRNGAILFNPNGFTMNKQAGILVRSRVDAVHLDGKLYFTSEHVVRRFLDIDYLFREATDQEIRELFSGPAFQVDDWKELNSSANVPLRRKLHVVQSSGKRIMPMAVRALAKRLERDVEVRKGKLVVPTAPAEFREFVRMLSDDYLESPLDHELWLTTSKRPAKQQT